MLSSRVLVAWSVAVLSASSLPAQAVDAPAPAPVLATAPVQAAAASVSGGYDGVVEAVRDAGRLPMLRPAISAIGVDARK